MRRHWRVGLCLVLSVVATFVSVGEARAAGLKQLKQEAAEAR